MNNFECVVELMIVLDECILEIYNVMCLYCFLREELFVIVDELESVYYVIICFNYVCEVV